MTIFKRYLSRYEASREENLSLQEYLDLCKKDPLIYASAAERQTRSADMLARAYQLGEGSLNDLLAARRLANEAQLAAHQQQLDALYLRYRLLLDTHRLWDMD